MASTGDLVGLEVTSEPNKADLTGAMDGIRTATDGAGVVRKVERRASIDGRPANNTSAYIDYESAGYFEKFAKNNNLQHTDSSGNLMGAGETAYPEAGLQSFKPPAPAPQPDRGESEVDGGDVAAAQPIGTITMDDQEKDGYKPTGYYSFKSKNERTGMNASNSLADLTGAE